MLNACTYMTRYNTYKRNMINYNYLIVREYYTYTRTLKTNILCIKL